MTSDPVSFAERVRAQRAIERVYFSYQQGAKKSFSEAVSEAVLRRKVETYLKQSAALERYWATPITGATLAAELRRITRGTRFPDRLARIFSALDDDPHLIMECFVRPVLVNRLTRSFFATDQRIHASARQEAELIRAELLGGQLDPSQEHPRRRVIRPGEEPFDDARALAGRPVSAASRLFASPGSEASLRNADPGTLLEDQDSFVVVGWAKNDHPVESMVLYVVPKVNWEDWWRQHSRRFDGTEAAVPPSRHAGLEIPAARPLAPLAAAPDCARDDTWDNGALAAGPTSLGRHLTVWTGSEMLVWGGVVGFRYDPLTDTWSRMSTTDAPSPRARSTAVWTGKEMIVWGGDIGIAWLNTGGRYDPLADAWSPTSLVNAPEGRSEHTAVWTGEAMIVWGGRSGSSFFNSGSRYDPASDFWSALPAAGAPTARSGHTAIWTGGEMIVWGGLGPGPFGDVQLFSTGGRYTPLTGVWRPTHENLAPAPRVDHTAIWTGTEMLVWGGRGAFSILGDGARYDPVADQWAEM